MGFVRTPSLDQFSLIFSSVTLINILEALTPSVVEMHCTKDGEGSGEQYVQGAAEVPRFAQLRKEEAEGMPDGCCSSSLSKGIGETGPEGTARTCVREGQAGC